MKLLLALAAPLLTGPGTIHFDGMPPERYLGPATVRVQFVSQDDIDRLCGTPPPPLQRMACARHDKRHRTYIVMPLPGPYADRGEYFAKLMAHETAHAAYNWPGDHPL